MSYSISTPSIDIDAWNADAVIPEIYTLEPNFEDPTGLTEYLLFDPPYSDYEQSENFYVGGSAERDTGPDIMDHGQTYDATPFDPSQDSHSLIDTASSVGSGTDLKPPHSAGRARKRQSPYSSRSLVAAQKRESARKAKEHRQKEAAQRKADAELSQKLLRSLSEQGVKRLDSVKWGSLTLADCANMTSFIDGQLSTSHVFVIAPNDETVTYDCQGYVPSAGSAFTLTKDASSVDNSSEIFGSWKARQYEYKPSKVEIMQQPMVYQQYDYKPRA